MQRLALVLFACVMLMESGLAQVPPDIQRYRDDAKGSYHMWRRGIMDGNRVRTVFFNTTEVAHWPDGIGGEWPKGSGHNYIDGMTVLIGAKVRLSNGKVITPIEAHYREEFDFDPQLGQQYPWDLEPLTGYIRENVTTPAMSSLPSSWPSAWPPALNLPTDYNGNWYSYFGKGIQKHLQETFFVVDDSKDREFIQSPGVGNPPYYPIPSDTSRGGLGLRVEVRTMQWDHPLAEDMIFFQYRIVNLSDQDYDSTSFGFYVDPGVGSYQRSSPANSMLPDTSSDLCYWWTEGGIGYPDNYKTGYLGLGFLKTPEDKGLTAATNNVLGDKGPTGVWPKNDNVMWAKLTGGVEMTPLWNNNNIGTVLGTGTFSLPKWQSDTVSFALLWGTDHVQIEGKQRIAQAIARNNYRVPDTLSRLNAFDLQIDSPSGGSMVSGTTNISWTVSGNVGKTTAFIYYSRQDTNWATIGTADQTSGTGQYTWNTTGEKDGLFYKLMIVCMAENGIAIAESDSTFAINNPGDGNPDVMAVMPVAGDILSGLIPIGWKAGDADGDPTTVSLYYQLTGVDQSWTPIAQNLPAAPSPYLWNTWEARNGPATVRIVAASGSNIAYADIPNVTIHNDRPVISGDKLITQRKTHGTGLFEVHIIDSSAITGDMYLVEFVELPPSGSLGYNVYNERTGEKTVESAGVGGPGSEGPLFDGLRLTISSDSTAVIDTASRWIAGSPDITLRVTRDDLNAARDFASPSDYEISWFSTNTDTALFNIPPRFPKLPVNFIITNLTQQKHVFFIIDDADRNAALSFGDTVRFVEDYVNTTTYKLTWQVTYDKGLAANPPPPSSGDRFVIRTSKPYQEGDTIVFATDAVLSVGGRDMEHPSGILLAQNYPNPFNPTTRIRYQVPEACHVRLSVYDLLGREVAVLTNEKKGAGSYVVMFDASALASGVYLYRLQAGLSVQTKKLVLLR